MIKRVCQFGEFRLDPVSRTLWRKGKRVELTGREMDTLLTLLEQPGIPVDKGVLASKIWGPTNVEKEVNLRQQIRALRRKLGKAYIVTVTNRGYQFAANVVWLEEETEPPNSVEPQMEKPVLPEAVLAETDRVAPRLPPIRPKRFFLALAVGLFAPICVVVWNFLPRQAELVGCRQLTHDGRQKDGGLFTDGNHIYFNEKVAGKQVIASVPVSGGITSYLKLPLISPSVAGISPGRKSLLVADVELGVLSELELASLTLHPIPLPAGTIAGAGAWNPSDSRIAINGTDSLTIFEPWKLSKPVQLHFPGQTTGSSWDPLGRRLRLAVFDTKTGTSRWWEVAATDWTARPLPRMSPNPAESHGMWTNDGRLFVFEAGQGGVSDQSQIWIAEGDGPRSYRLTNDALTWRDPTFVPGHNTVVASARQSQAQLARLSASGHETPGRSPVPGVPAYELDYSRDGQWIVYTLFPEQTLWRCRPDGNESKQLTPLGVEAHQPHWSPDGTRIAFMGKRRGDGTRWRLYIVSSLGGSPDEPLPDGDDQGVPTWSPDGRSLFFGDLKTPRDFDHAGIHQLNLQTGVVSPISAPVSMWSPRMSPDGTHLAAVSHDNKALYIRDNMRKTWRKCATMDLVEEPIWPRDSSWIQFIGSPRPGEKYLFRSSPACEQTRKVLDLLVYDFVGSTWIGIAPDHSPTGLLSIPHEIYALDWRIHSSFP